MRQRIKLLGLCMIVSLIALYFTAQGPLSISGFKSYGISAKQTAQIYLPLSINALIAVSILMVMMLDISAEPAKHKDNLNLHKL